MNENHWKSAFYLNEDFKNGKNFFKSGSLYYQNYLQPFINLIYSKTTGDPLYEISESGELKISKTDKKILLLFFSH